MIGLGSLSKTATQCVMISALEGIESTSREYSSIALAHAYYCKVVGMPTNGR